jgi:hypothetical protein
MNCPHLSRNRIISMHKQDLHKNEQSISYIDTPRTELTGILGLTIACRTCPNMVLLSDT